MLPGTKIVHQRLAGFNKGAAEDLRQALSKIKKEGAAGIVLDLRDNPGGLLDEAVDVASQFLQSGNVLLEKDARGRETPVAVEAGGDAQHMPLVELVNGGTASGAEFVAGAFQDNHRAQLVGETTLGTGTVLNEFKLTDGSALLLAIEQWLTPDGHVIWHKGITPNIVVKLPPDVLPVFPEAEHTMNAAQLRGCGDTQLLRAMDLLRLPASKSS